MTPLLSAREREHGSATENLPLKKPLWIHTIWIGLICINIIKSNAQLNCIAIGLFGSRHHYNPFKHFINFQSYNLYFTSISSPFPHILLIIWMRTMKKKIYRNDYNIKLETRQHCRSVLCPHSADAIKYIKYIKYTGSQPSNYYRFANAQWANMKLWLVKCWFI